MTRKVDFFCVYSAKFNKYINANTGWQMEIINLILLYMLSAKVNIANCDSKCPTRHFFENGQCYDCPLNCIYCSSRTNCSACIREYKGPVCNNICENCLPGTSCNQYSGYCFDGCEVGLSGDGCNTRCKQNCANCNRTNNAICYSCDKGHWGNQCELKCPVHCSETVCVKTDGTCIGGCKDGYTGVSCMCPANCTCDASGQCLRCERGSGIICDDTCSEGCIGNLCLTNGGRCLEGCLKGYDGDFCKKEAENSKTLILLVLVVVPVTVVAGSVLYIFYKNRKTRKVQRRNEDYPLELHNTLVGGNIKTDRHKTPKESSPLPQATRWKTHGTETRRSKETTTFTVDAEDDDNRSYEEISVDYMYASDKRSKGRCQQNSASSRSAKNNENLEELTEETVQEELKNLQTGPGSRYCGTDTLLRNPVPLKNLKSYINSRFLTKTLEEEFKSLPLGLIKPCTEATKKENLKKNRYRGIYPYDENRVKINKANDYINASCINGYERQPRAYIACVGPTREFMGDMCVFWELVWQENCSTIVMLADLCEQKGIHKTDTCDQYWPDKNYMQVYGEYRVTWLSRRTLDNYTLLSLEVDKGKESRCIKHVQYITWPKRGTPNVKSFSEFQNVVNDVRRDKDGPLLVHCSAGIGRTGVFIALDILTKEGETEGRVNIYNCVKTLREQRVNMISSLEQYEFLHRALLRSLKDLPKEKSKSNSR